MKKHLFLLTIIMLVSLLALSGCGGTTEDGASADANPEQVVLSFINAMKNLDLEEAKGFLSTGYSAEFDSDFEELAAALEEDGLEAEAMREMFNIIFANFDFNVTGHSIDGDSATVDMSSTAPDIDQLGELLMGRFFEVLFSGEVDLENLTEEEEMMLMVNIFSEVIGEVDKVETSVEVPLLKVDGQWKIDGVVVEEVVGAIDF